MKCLLIIFASLFVCRITCPAQQRVIAECTVTYAISVDSTSDDKSLYDNLRSATKTVYIKGNNCRTDLIGSALTQSTFYDKTKGTATILREFGSNKFITKLDSAKWEQEKNEFDSILVTATNITQKIIGYDCKNVLLQLKDGKTYDIYYTPTLLPSVREFEYAFKDIPGFVLAYQVQQKNGKKITYTATKINLSPVPASKFDIPSKGYRVLER